MQSPFCVGHNWGHPWGCQSSSAPLLPLPVPPWMSVQPFQASQAELDPQNCAGGAPPVPCRAPGPSLSPCQRQPWSCSSAVRLALAALCRGRDSGSKFSLMKRLYFLFGALLPAVMAPALPPAPQHPSVVLAGGEGCGMMSRGAGLERRRLGGSGGAWDHSPSRCPRSTKGLWHRGQVVPRGCGELQELCPGSLN